MGKFVKAVIGAALVVGVTLLTGGTLTAALIAGALSLASATILAPKMAGAGERQASETTLQLGEGPRQVGFGRFATGGSLLDGFNYGGQYGTDWEVLLIALADHECDALEGFYVNDEYVSFAGNGVVSGYSGQLEVHWLPGTATQAWPSFVTANGVGWADPDNNCKGVSCVAVAYKADKPDAKNPVWTAGRPRFLWVLRGKKCYQARKDSTVPGGSGSHRWADPSTWEWTDNAAECRYQYQRGIFALDQVDAPDQLLLGRGLSAIEAPPERSIAHTNVCDELVALDAGGAEKRYRFNGMIGADEDFLTAESYFAAAMGGVIRQPDGGIEVEPGQAKAVAAEITDLDILNLAEGQVEHFRGQADKEWLNTVVVRYVEPGQKWAMHSAPVRRNTADIIADGGQRLDTTDIKHVTSVTQAGRLAEIKRRLGRLLTTATVPLGPRFAGLEEGDWIGWTSDRHFEGARKVFRVDSYSRDKGWKMTLTLREIAASVYDDAAEIAPTAAATQQSAPGAIGAPGAGAWTLTGGVVAGATGLQPALFVTGAADNSYAQAVRIEYRLSGDTDWIDAGSLPRSATSKTITGVADQTAYEVAVTNVVDGEPGDRLVLGPVTAGNLATASAARTLVTKTDNYPLSSNDTSITVAAFSGVTNNGLTIAFPAATISSLASGGDYVVLWDIADEVYIAVAYPALTQMASPDYVYIGRQQTSTGGVFDDPEPPPPGTCPADDTLILLADGGTAPARDLAVGTLVRTQHERTLAWGDYPVAAIEFVDDQPVYTCALTDMDGNPVTIRATADHLFLVANRWARAADIGTLDGTARVAKITVSEAHTYVSAGVLSHNIKAREAL